MRDRLIELLKRKYDHFCDQCGINKDSHYTENLADYLLENGVIVPPCKVGDNVWLKKPLNWQHMEWGIEEGKISMIQQKADKSWKFRVTENHSVQDYTVDSIGKTVFFTREEAKAKLKEGGKG
jgi:hypothetical protein